MTTALKPKLKTTQIDSTFVDIGFLCNLGNNTQDPKSIWSNAILYRAVTINNWLKNYGARLFFYSPKFVDTTSATATGFYLENQSFTRCTRPVPKLNANWAYKVHSTLKDNIGYDHFVSWCENNKITFFTPLEFSDLCVNKLETYKLIDRFEKNLHPHTESFKATKTQIKKFFDHSNTIFVKPRSGNRGNDILVLRQQSQHNFSVTHYNEKLGKQVSSFSSIEDLLQLTIKLVSDRSYIIQHGIDTFRHNNAAFDIRSIVIHNGNSWQWVHELRLGASGNDVSNIAQGGIDLNTEVLLTEMFSKSTANNILNRIKEVSFRLASYLNCFFPNQLIEIAFDFILDQQQNIFLAEVNSKPGHPGPPDYSNIFEISQEESADFEFYINQPSLHLANYFGFHLQNQQSQPVWFDSITNPLLLSNQELQQLCITILTQIKRKSFDSTLFSRNVLEDQTSSIIFLSISDGVSPAFVACGTGIGLTNALKSAYEQLAPIHSQSFKLQSIKLDFVTQTQQHDLRDWEAPLNIDRSLQGIAFNQASSIAFLPEQLTTNTLINNQQLLRPKNIQRYLKSHPRFSRVWRRHQQHLGNHFFSFTTNSFFFDGDSLLNLYRGHRMFDTVDSNHVIHSLELANHYLKSIVKPNGAFIYSYLPKKDQVADRYNFLRHSGTTFAMLELYEKFKDPEMLSCAKSAISFILSHRQPKTISGIETSCIIEKGFVKLGGNALTILMLAKYTETTGDMQHLATMQSLARWMTCQQLEDGRYEAHKQDFKTDEIKNFTSEYYPGEAIFSLVRLYNIDNNPEWLDSAEKNAQFLINIRDKGLKTEKLIHDHWLLYGLNELYRHRANDLYLTQAMRIATAITLTQHHKKAELDWNGGYYSPPRSTPTATRMEGLCAAYALAKDFNEPEMAQKIRTCIDQCVKFQLQTQFHPESAMYLPNPKRALGGFHQSLTNFEIRIDYVQHNVSALIAYNRILNEG